MAEEKLLTVRDVSLILGLSEKEVMDLAESGRLAAYKVGGLYLRFRKEQVDDFRKAFAFSAHKPQLAKKYSFKDRLSDFFYFNDFYILTALIILFMLFVIFKG
ncbi:MAG TPA: helix-turn-helix domain-containing protein [Candidatus Omnitrophota bacterium]|nr:helix-turn-helix domain-containing protein [Candidatus Omnitrophota bacterium]